MRQRNPQNLTRQKFDILVVGGGITGTGIALDAALRGHSVALIEQYDWAAGTSSRSSRLIHGGIRYLENAQLKMVLQSVRERELLLTLAKELVHPLHFTWPVYKHSRIQKTKLIAGMTVYDIMARTPKPRRHKWLNSHDTHTGEPSLLADELTGSATYFDALTNDCQLVTALAMAARDAGAQIANLVKFTGKGKQGNQWTLLDKPSNTTILVQAKVLIMAPGPWQTPGSKGTHITVPTQSLGNRNAVTMTSPLDGRVLFALPYLRPLHPDIHQRPTVIHPGQPLTHHHKYQHVTVIGTTDTLTTDNPENVRATKEDVEYLLKNANFYFPDAELKKENVVSAWAGIRPLAHIPPPKQGQRTSVNPGKIPREHSITIEKNVVKATGGKITTYRAMAQEAVNKAETIIGKKSPCITKYITLGEEKWRNATIREIEEQEPNLKQPLSPNLPFTHSDIAYVTSHEMANSIADVLIRRTGIAFETPDQGHSLAPIVAQVMANVLNWSTAETRRQLERWKKEKEKMFTWHSP